MRREQLEHAIRTACQIIGRSEVIIVGSQAILGTYSETQLPVETTMSIEVDVLPIDDDRGEVDRLADLIEGAAGEFSQFDETHGFHINGVDLGTAILPAGWRDRLVRVQNANTTATGGHPRFTGWCLSKEDLCVSKLCAHREKDLNFVAALLDHGLVDPMVVMERVDEVEGRHARAADLANLVEHSPVGRAVSTRPESHASLHTRGSLVTDVSGRGSGAPVRGCAAARCR